MVLDDVSFMIERGKCLALLGPSGCGKSTILNILAGLLSADAGKVIQGERVLENPERGILIPAEERRFAMVFQDLSLWPHMTVAENVAFGLDYLPAGQRLSEGEKQDRVASVLEKVGMHQLRERYPSTLSGGQQQRVAIARAIAVEPSVLLMDEPLASLDAQLRENLRDEIAALIRRLNITTVYVTHDHSEAMTVAHQVAVMNQGTIEQIGAPSDIFDYPETTFVARFLNCANVVPFTYDLEDLRDEAGQRLFPPHPPAKKRGFLLVRREHVRIFLAAQAREFPGDGQVRWRGQVTKNSFMERRNEVHAVTKKGDIFRGFSPEPIPLDSDVFIQFDPHEVIFVER